MKSCNRSEVTYKMLINIEAVSYIKIIPGYPELQLRDYNEFIFCFFKIMCIYTGPLP